MMFDYRKIGFFYVGIMAIFLTSEVISATGSHSRSDSHRG